MLMPMPTARLPACCCNISQRSRSVLYAAHAYHAHAIRLFLPARLCQNIHANRFATFCLAAICKRDGTAEATSAAKMAARSLHHAARCQPRSMRASRHSARPARPKDSRCRHADSRAPPHAAIPALKYAVQFSPLFHFCHFQFRHFFFFFFLLLTAR